MWQYTYILDELSVFQMSHPIFGETDILRSENIPALLFFLESTTIVAHHHRSWWAVPTIHVYLHLSIISFVQTFFYPSMYVDLVLPCCLTP